VKNKTSASVGGERTHRQKTLWLWEAAAVVRCLRKGVFGERGNSFLRGVRAEWLVRTGRCRIDRRKSVDSRAVQQKASVDDFDGFAFYG